MEIEKIIALAQHLDLDYCEYNEIYYAGVTQEEIEEKLEEFLENNNREDTKAHEEFQEWLDENTTLLEDEFENSYDDYYSYGNQEYLVLTDSEANDAAYNSVMSIWEDCYLTKEVKQQLGFLENYIDLAAATEDAIKADGRGHTLASYDGHEYYKEVDGEIYYIYRIN